ncbi:hypothetical protein, conserved [Leishmania tarentolae]|uniref:Uncharacterized protein n=1 Tax=Leishmania tarentolae TaxID=5689 RepID=A0A640KW84_LEITA|nr:hypothetical protein, conserved [Leishmania tarentolae]
MWATGIALMSKRSRKYQTKLHHRFRNPSVLPLKQTKAQRDETIRSVLQVRNISPCNQSSYRYVEQRLYSTGSRLDREGVKLNTTYALQGLGDLEPLRNSKSFGFSEREALKYDSLQQAAKYEAPPVPFTPLAARKLAEGKLWPSAPEPDGMLSKEVRHLRHRANMSPSAQTFSDKIAYHLRRSLKACPAHIAEQMDFAQLIIEEVIASRRSKSVYVVWATVDPAARFAMEPQLHRLNHWVQRLIMERIRTRPNIPQISWIYNGGRLERELPRELKEEMQAYASDNSSTLEMRVRYLKEMDTVNQRMRNIPWFMPYLWSKEEKAGKTRRMRKDLEEYEQRRLAAKKDQRESDRDKSGRSVAPQIGAPPAYVR